jgi:pyruvate/2-oxoglutarate dehydrogenase complex dihydrolipoamide dehydrogenase (E3) component
MGHADVAYRDAATGEEFHLHAEAVLLATGRKPNTEGTEPAGGPA